jgi:hypothetical protein
LHPRKYTDEQIKELLLDDQLDYLSGSYMKKLREQCRPPDPFFPDDKNHRRSRNFLIAEGVEDLFDNTRAVQAAKAILKTPRAKEMVEAMTLTHVPPRQIALALSTQRGSFFDEEAVNAYRRYFWNIELLDSTEMRALLFQRAAVPELHQDAEVKAQAKSFKSASYTDPRRVAAQMAHSPVGARLAQMRMGYMPRTQELAKLVETVRLTALARSLEMATYGGPEDSIRALNYAITAEKMGNILEQIVRPDEELRSQLSAIALRTNAPNKAPSIRQLSGGSHTIDLLPGVKTNASRSNNRP